MVMDYIAIIHKDPDSDFGVSFPGCITAGRTLDEAEEMAREALSGHVVLTCEAGEPLPEPSIFDQVMSDPQFRDGAAFFCKSRSAGENRAHELTLTRDEMHNNARGRFTCAADLPQRAGSSARISNLRLRSLIRYRPGAAATPQSRPVELRGVGLQADHAKRALRTLGGFCVP
jgi:predicted RNase H-like HicB family nuclease